LFSNPQKNIFKGIISSLTNVPLKIIGTFGDIVSYIRLFAVGYASTVLSVTFNNMAQEVGFNNIISGIIAALILFAGHALNITLGFMAVIVHGILAHAFGHDGDGKDLMKSRMLMQVFEMECKSIRDIFQGRFV